MSDVSVGDVLSAALDAGTAIGTILVFFMYVCRVCCGEVDSSQLRSLQYPDDGRIGQSSVLSWWGNTVWVNTADWNGTPFITLEPGQTFGPSSWS